MSAKRGPTLRAQWLGQQLRELRNASELTLDDAAEFLQRSAGTVSRFESGVYPIRRGDVMALLALYRVSDEQQRNELFKLSEEAWQTGWWDGYADDVPGALMDLTWLESRASQIHSFDALTFPGLLQVESYARATIEAVDPDAPAEQIERWVEFRTKRQDVLAREEPPHLSVLLDEMMLYRPIGGPDVMAEQLAHLVDAAQAPNIEIRILPLRTGGHASLAGSFRIMVMSHPYPDVAHMDTPAGSIYVEAADTEQLSARYDRMRSSTLDLDKSVELLSTLAEDCGDRTDRRSV